MSDSILKAGKFKTDKSQEMLDNYARWFNHLKNKKISMLELGVLDAGSLALWHKYFPKGTIAGLDIKPVVIENQPARIKTYRGLQQDSALLRKIAKETAPGGFDIIIDDASHIGEFTKTSFTYLFNNHLKKNGIYVIEDWGTGYWQVWPDGKFYQQERSFLRRHPKGHFPGHQQGMVGFIKQLVDEQGMADITSKERGSGKYRRSKFRRMEISHAQVAVFKR